MIKNVLGSAWRRAPKFVRRWGVRLTQSQFRVTVGAVILDSEGRILLLKHVFRPGSGWGVPGGFINPDEDPEAALRRELQEEIGLELNSARIALARTLKGLRQVELIYRCTTEQEPRPLSIEIAKVEWFALDDLPAGLSSDMRGLIFRVLADERESVWANGNASANIPLRHNAQ
jgi:8-oxo-dGTP diphosphatase